MTTALNSLLPLSEVALAVEETLTTPVPTFEYGRLADIASALTYVALLLRVI